jgi:cobalt-zinc-cadmium efflux system protein
MRAASGQRSTTLEMVMSGVIKATWGASRAVRDTDVRTSNCTVAIVHRPAAERSRLLIALGLAIAVFAIEAIASIFANSLALLAEAFHVLIDVVALGIAFVAVWLSARPPTDRRTFGLLRLEILATVLNTVLLLVVATVVLLEGVRRFSEPSHVQSGLVLAVATFGLISNGVSILLLRDRTQSLAVRAAYLDVLADVVGSAAVIVSALANLVVGRPLADTLAAFLIVALIVPRSFTLLREALDVLLEATPRDVDVEALRQHVLACSGVRDIHDLHVWTITSGVNVLSAHVVVQTGADPASVLDDLESCLRGDFDIEHSTFQLESEDRKRLERSAHP